MTSRRLLQLCAAIALTLTASTRLVGAVDGGWVEPVGGGVDHGDLSGLDLVSPIVGMAPTPSGDGYWMVAADGGVFAFGAASFHGSMGAVALNEPVVGITSTPTGQGYWLVASDGGVFSFGDAQFHGSAGAIPLNRPIAGIAATPSGAGYWLIGDDGGVFAFGDAGFMGSTGGLSLNRPIVAAAATPTGNGYWLLADDGGVFTFGDAAYFGSAPADQVHGDFIAIISSATGAGYAIVQSTGRVVGYGDSPLDRVGSCSFDPVVTAAGLALGAALLRRNLPIPAGPASSQSSGRDNAHIETRLRHAQACQPAGTPALGQFLPPTNQPVVTSRFGPRVHPIWGVAGLHAGIDYIGSYGPNGIPVLAAEGGTVVAVEARVAYGTTIAVDHGNRIATIYAHLGRVDVVVGDTVTRGQTLGAMGSTGFATGAHLHFEVRLDGVPVDPAPYLSPVAAATLTSIP